MADFNKPATTDTYVNVLAYLKATIADLALGLDPANTTPTNVPTNAVRWNSANNRFEKYNGTAWAIWTTTLALTNLTASGTLSVDGVVTLNGGTANGIGYLNASKQFVSGGALTFDGTNFATTGNATAAALIPTGSAVPANGMYLPAASTLAWALNSAENMRLTTTGLGLGNSNPAYRLDVTGSARVSGSMILSGGTANGVPYLNASNVLTTGSALTFDGTNLKATGGNGGNLTLDNGGQQYTQLLLQRNGTLNTGGDLLIDGTGNLFNFRALAANMPFTWSLSATAGSPSEQMRLTSTGLVLGTTSNLGGGRVEALSNGTSAYTARSTSTTGANGGTSVVSVRTVDSSASYWANAQYDAWQHIFRISGSTEAARIDSSGRWLVGTSSNIPSSTSSQIAAFNGRVLFGNVGGSDQSTTDAAIVCGGTFEFWRDGVNGTQLHARIRSVGEGGYIAGIAFDTYTYTSSYQYVERLRIFSSGGVSIGNTTDPGASNLSVSGTVADGTATLRPLVQSTSQATTSGTTKDFTSIPSWAKKITVIFQGVSTNGAANLQVVLGTGATPTYTTSGYAGGMSYGNNAIVTGAMSSGFDCSYMGSTNALVHGQVVLTNLTGNVWAMLGTVHHSETTTYSFSAGSVSLAAALTAVRITAGGNTFDAGNVNIIYE